MADLWERIDESFRSAREHMQTHTDSAWLQRLDGAVSDLVGMLIAWSRLVVACAILTWSFFLVVLPLLLGTAIIIGIITLASPRALP